MKKITVKRTIDWIFIIGAVGLIIAGIGMLFPGCNKKFHARKTTQENRPHHPLVVYKTVPSKPEQAKPTKEILPRTIEYLDLKNGFRDAIFGRQETNFDNLVLKEQDEARQLKTYTRSDDVLSLEGTPLESIEYTFFKGQLYKILLTWKVEHEEDVIAKPPSTDIPQYFADLYGPPTKHRIQKDQLEFRWRGRKVDVLLTEILSSGVPNVVNGGWSLPPTTMGRMVFESIPLRNAVDAFAASKTYRSQDGL